MNFESTIHRFIEDHHLLFREGRYLVAVSGGADSVALLLLLKQDGYDIEAAHCNFHLRGEESLRDEEFVKGLCKKLDIRLHLAHFDTKTYAELHKMSIEMAARELRYRSFEQRRTDLQATDICVAHHQDDSVETILLNLLRGTGIHGLTGIHPRQGHIVRPLLCVSRKEIENWLERQGQDYVTDSSNLVADVWRNKLRLNVIPQLLDITPQAPRNILNTAGLLAETAQIADEAISKTLARIGNDNSLSLNKLLSSDYRRSILFAWLGKKGFSSAMISQIAQQIDTARNGSTWMSETHELCVDRGKLLLQERQPTRLTLHIPETGTYVYEPEVKIRVSISTDMRISRDVNMASLDADKIRFPLTLRPVQTGDRFVPLGMTNGSKLVSDYLTDRKMSVFSKRRQLILTDADGKVLWLVGQRPDNRVKIDGTTTRILLLTLDKQNTETQRHRD